MIDLTRQIHLYCEERDGDVSQYPIPRVIFEPDSTEEAQAYRTLFQESPRTKLDYEDLVELAKYALQDGEYQWRSELWAFVKDHEEPGSVERGADGKLLRTLDGWEERRVWVDDFERTKLEHGKMLAMLQRIAETYSRMREVLNTEYESLFFDSVRALIAEIEGPPLGYRHDPDILQHSDCSITTTNIRPAPPLGEIEGAAQ